MRTSSSPIVRALRPLLAFAALSPLAASAQVIFMDFGTSGNTTTESGKSWNNVTSVSAMGSSASLLDYDTNLASGLSYQITDAFQATGSSAPNAATEDFSATAVRDYFYGSDGNAPDRNAQITFTGFDPSKQYTFTFLASSNSAAGSSNNRSTLFSLTGSATNQVTQDAAGNNLTTVSILSVSPSVSGTFVLDVSKALANTNSNGYYHLNALKIEAVAVPEPSAAAALLGLGALGMCVLRRKR